MKNSRIYLEHILESINLINEYIENINEDEFYELTSIQDAVVRRLEIIGEAVKKLPEDIKEQYKDVPWKEIAGMRDILIHEYFGIDLKLTWRTVKTDLPKLKNNIVEMLEIF